MEYKTNMKSLFIIVNAGFSSDVIDIAREAGAKGATIINARGESASHHMFMGITVDSEREVILTLVEAEVAEKVMAALSAKTGHQSPAHCVCFTLPVESMIGISGFPAQCGI